MRNKISEEESIKIVDQIIGELVYPKTELQKAYNLYNGVRDPEQFKFLEDNYGLGNPTSIQFTPLIRKHVDAIVGEYSEVSVLPKVSCRDEETISNINREKELNISEQLVTSLKNHLNNSIVQYINGKSAVDTAIEKQLQTLIEDVDINYTSNYEIAAQNVIEYLLQSRQTDFKNKRKQLLLDLLTSGYAYYQVKPSAEETNIVIKVWDPRNVFTDNDLTLTYANKNHRVVLRDWKTRTQILSEYGSKLSKENIEKIENSLQSSATSNNYYVVSNGKSHDVDGASIIPGFPGDRASRQQLLPVYEVEWIEPDKDFVLQRYEATRIGDEVYIINGQSKNVIRSKDNPKDCTITLNGIFMTNRDCKAYSLVLACADLQDKYDILHFYRDSLIANSGVSGDWLDISMLPTELGVDLPERVLKWIAYKKSGVALVNTAEEGRGFNNNTVFNGFDDAIKIQTIQGIEMAIDRTESTCSSITGVFRERLNGITQKDAVTNVKTGVQNSYTVTSQFTDQMDTLTTEMLNDSLNLAKVVYSKGLTGVIILGDKLQRIFTAEPKYFTLTDFNIHIVSGTEILKDMETIKTVINEFIQAGKVDPEIIIEAVNAKSITELKLMVKKALKKKKEEDNQLGQLQQQNEQLQQQLQSIQKELQDAQNKLKLYDDKKMELEKEKFDHESKIAWYNAQTERDYKEGSLKNESKKTEVEVAQLYDNNPYNNEIRND